MPLAGGGHLAPRPLSSLLTEVKFPAVGGALVRHKVLQLSHGICDDFVQSESGESVDTEHLSQCVLVGDAVHVVVQDRHHHVLEGGVVIAGTETVLWLQPESGCGALRSPIALLALLGRDDQGVLVHLHQPLAEKVVEPQEEIPVVVCHDQ